jgi:hypothetical protein
VKETGFREFVEQHRALYDATEARMKALLEKEAHLEWFNNWFGGRPQASFTVALGLLNGGGCYGPHFRDAAGKEELYCVLGVWQTHAQGLPQFASEMLATVIHEFAHSYANPIIDHHLKELSAAGKKLYAPVAGQMRSQAYGDPATLLRESLVRACVVRYVRKYEGTAAARSTITSQIKRGFLWMQELCEQLEDYERQRDQYPTLEVFAPRLVEFFDKYAAGFGEKQAELAAKRPKVVSMTPKNGAADVDPGLSEIKVTFDRPMKDRSWSMCGGGPHFPSGDGKPYYEASRTTWTVPVTLKPDWDYEFWLNSESYDAFRSADGVPLEPVAVKFKTAPAKPSGGSGDKK